MAAAERWKPGSIRLLIVAESPPLAEDRYFYYEDVTGQDSLWVETMKALYEKEFGATKLERSRKAKWLARFRDDGCFLIDAVKHPLSGSSISRVTEVRAHAGEIVHEIRELDPDAVLLVKATVWDGLHLEIGTAGLPLMNDGSVPFPGSGQQRRFHDAFERLGVREFVQRSSP